MTTIERTPDARPRRALRIFLGLGALAALGAGWYLFSPLIFNSTVIEEFPSVATTVVEAVADPDVPADEAPPTTTAPAGSEATAPAAGSTGGPETAPPPAAGQGPVALAAGEFVDADSFHQGSGSATIYELEDGSRVLRLEDFDVTNGPDLHVFISPAAVPENQDDVMGAGYIDLGELKGNRGDQNYEIPAGAVLPDGDFSVVIYCVPFHVVFSTATLTG